MRIFQNNFKGGIDQRTIDKLEKESTNIGKGKYNLKFRIF
jgi:hypothetical protein